MTKYLIILLVVLAGYAHGFDFADFVNDFHSDLAPLLTLFGEKVTMQYISQAMRPLDCIALALAPLGIITIMVSAIRAGGPTVLKAIVGRAKENTAAAELELMSSTSREVCELFNGGNIVRCLGSGSVWQYICLFQKGTGNGQVKFMSLQDATDNGLLIETHGTTDEKPEEDARSPQDRDRECESTGSATGITPTKQITLQRIRRRLWKSGPREPDTEACLELGPSHTAQEPAREPGQEPVTKEPGREPVTKEPSREPAAKEPGQEPATVIVVYDDVPEAPNISINLQDLGSRQFIWVVVVFGFVLQTAVLGFFVLIQFNPKVQTLLKIKESLQLYGFCMAFGGTLFMAIGMFLCVDVVEKSTSEKVYQANDQFDMRLYWLQQNQTVNDQVFQSFATFPNRYCTRFLKSRRAGTSQDRQTAKKLQTNTRLGIALGLLGFIVQFVGFRGFHPTAPLAQLVAIMMMTVGRAVARPGFTKNFGTVKLLHGFEQDWLTHELAQHLAKKLPQKLPQSLDDGNKERHGVALWGIVTGRDVDYRAFERLVACNKSQTPSQVPDSEAQRLLVMRKGFYGKAKTRTLSSKCATQLAIAMEKALGILFPDGPGCQTDPGISCPHGTRREGGSGFRWVIDVAVKGATQPVSIDLSYKEDTLRWKVEADDLHAVLSLWVHAAWVQRNAPRPDDGHAEADEDTWICRDVCEPSLKALGCRNYRLRHQVMKDLETWATQSRYILAGIMEIWKAEVEKQKKEEEGEQQKGANRERETNCARAVDRRVESHDSIVGLYASDLLFSFMWSMAKTLPVRLGREGKRIQPFGPLETKPWGNTTMTELISAFREASHWSEHETCLGVISPLSILGKLPIQPWFHAMSEAIMDARRSKDQALINTAMKEAVMKALNLILTYKPGTSGIHERGLAWLEEQEQLRVAMHVPFEFELESEFPGTWRYYLSRKYRVHLWDRLFFIHTSSLREPLTKLWEIQQKFTNDKRLPDCFGFIRENRRLRRRYRRKLRNDKRLPDHFDFTTLHELAARGKQIGSDAPAELKALVNVQDVTGWTPIFYACAAKNLEMVGQLLDLGADATLADIHGYTPAHHACLSGCKETLAMLASKRVDLGAQAINGAKPIHLAAGKGCDDVITYLESRKPRSLRHEEAVDLDFDNRTPMHWAAAGGHVQALKALAGDLNAQDDSGWSPLHVAILAGQKHLISTLHQPSTDVERRDMKGRTPLILACAEKRWEFVEELIEICAKVDAADSNNMTSLHYLVTRGEDAESATMIPVLTKGLDRKAIKQLTELRNRDGHTPLELAVVKGRLDTINKLLELGADANLANSRGQRPLFLALVHAEEEDVAFRVTEALVRGEHSLGVKSQIILDAARMGGFSKVVSFLEERWKYWHARPMEE
ncbi:hypothetical protein LCI18_002265 [Fusarium solani-melongenae]|uniref:Uncharacterized protein n=1 Tax=Fusarium solani subsp. cucurbitae TaxID=2747967 RepID=A0ACD3YR14_FUSSC|nr:hypothetical protein LCI18_002265 [Fusarium solani-melongenae]